MDMIIHVVITRLKIKNFLNIKKFISLIQFGWICVQYYFDIIKYGDDQ